MQFILSSLKAESSVHKPFVEKKFHSVKCISDASKITLSQRYSITFQFSEFIKYVKISKMKIGEWITFTCESGPFFYASPCKICEHEQENGGTFASVGAQNFSLDYANVIIKFAQKC